MTQNTVSDDLTLRKYVLSCKTKFITKHVSDEVAPGKIMNYQRHMVILIPDDNDQRTRFLIAWSPEVVTEYHELASVIGAPVHGTCRLSVHRGGDDKCEKPYLFVMSKGVEEILLKKPEGTLVKVETMPSNMDSEADSAADSSDGNYEVL